MLRVCTLETRWGKLRFTSVLFLLQTYNLSPIMRKTNMFRLGTFYEISIQYSWKLSKTKSETPHSQEEPLETWWLNVTSDPGWDPGIEKRILGENEGYLLDVCAQLLQSCPTLCDAMDCRQLGSSVHGISQARILEWVATPSSRVSSQPKDLTCVSCTGRWILYPLGHLWTLVNNNTLESVH